MKIKQDSLLFKAILYNDISILLTAFIMFFVLGYYIFKDINTEIPLALEKASKNIITGYDMFSSERKKEFYKFILSNEFESTLEEVESLNYTLVDKDKAVIVKEMAYKLLHDIRIRNEEFSDTEHPINDFITVIDETGRILAEESGEIGESFSMSNSQYLNENISTGAEEVEFLEHIANKNLQVLRIGRLIDDKYIFLSIVLDEKFLKLMEAYLGASDGINTFLLNGLTYLNGDLEIETGRRFISLNQFKKLINTGCLLDRVKIKNVTYDTAYCSMEIAKNNYLIIGVALSRYEIFNLKASYYLIGILTLIFLLTTASSVFGYKYYKLFLPLIKLSEVSDQISQGELDVKIRIKSSGEIKSLVNSFRKMLKTIKANHRDLELQNEKLKESITKINMVEKLLLNIHSEDNIDKIIYYILTAFTSEVGLNYGRAIYFEYDEEAYQLNGKLASTNIRLVDESNKLYKFTSGLKLQTESLDKIIKLISVQLDENILAEAFLKKQIIYHNDRGFNFNLGNELLVSLGLNNFIIMPVYSSSKKYGLIVLDNSATRKQVVQEDVEMLNLLSMNITIHLENKELHDQKVETERKAMIGRLSKKILLDIQQPLNEIRDLIDGHILDQKSMDITEIEELKNKMTQVAGNSSLLFDYSDAKSYNMEKLDVGEVLDKSIQGLKQQIKSGHISISKLYNHKEYVMGNFYKLEKVFSNLLKNSIEAVADENHGRITITTTSQEHRTVIKINDNGIGIAEENQKQIFEPFVSVNKNASGLGLSVAKKIIKEHSGEIKIRSTRAQGTEIKTILNIYKEE